MILQKLIILTVLCLVSCQLDAMKRTGGPIFDDRLFFKEPKIEEAANEVLNRGDYFELWGRIAAGINNPNEKDQHGYPLILNFTSKPGLTEQDEDEFLRFFAEHGADMNAQAPDTKITLLHAAVSEGNLSRINTLLKLGADANSKDYIGRKPLNYLGSMKVVGVNQIDIAKALIHETDLIHVTTHDGSSFLHDIGLDESPKKLLVLAGVPVNIENHYGETAYEYLKIVSEVAPNKNIKTLKKARKRIIVPALTSAMQPDEHDDHFPAMPACLLKGVFNRETAGPKTSNSKLLSRYRITEG